MLVKYTTQLVKESSVNYRVCDVQADSPRSIAEVLAEGLELSTKLQEEMWVLMLNVKCKIIGASMISRGGISSCAADTREVFRPAIVAGAYAVILAHNHPSGDPTPSEGDLTITKRLKEAGEILGVQVLDHIIVGDHIYHSMKEHGEVF